MDRMEDIAFVYLLYLPYLPMDRMDKIAYILPYPTISKNI